MALAFKEGRGKLLIPPDPANPNAYADPPQYQVAYRKLTDQAFDKVDNNAGRFSIVLNGSREVHVGSSISGKVVLSSSVDEIFTEVTVSLVGRARSNVVTYRTSSGRSYTQRGYAVSHYDHAVLFAKTIVLSDAPMKLSGTDWMVREWPFTFEFPQHLQRTALNDRWYNLDYLERFQPSDRFATEFPLPPTFNHWSVTNYAQNVFRGSIDYMVEAQLTWSYKKDDSKGGERMVRGPEYTTREYVYHEPVHAGKPNSANHVSTHTAVINSAQIINAPKRIVNYG